MDHLPRKVASPRDLRYREKVFFNILLGLPAANSAAGVNHSGGSLAGTTGSRRPAPVGHREEHVLDFLFGEGQYGLRFLFAFIVVLGLIGLFAWLARRFGASNLGAPSARGLQPRLP